MDAQRLLLESLMAPLVPQKHKKNWRDEDVCKNYLCGMCPYEMFANTKVDLGKCNLLHDDNLQKEYLAQVKERPYDLKFYDFLGRLMVDVERAMKRGYSRLESKSDVVFENLDDIHEKITILEEQIAPKLNEICEFGESGRVAEAMDLFYHVNKLATDLENSRASDPNHHSYRPDKRMEVCTVCGALLANDATGGRIEAHMIGKQHTGFQKIRKALETHNKQAANAPGGATGYGAGGYGAPRPASGGYDRPGSGGYDRPQGYGGGGYGGDRQYGGSGRDRRYR